MVAVAHARSRFRGALDSGHAHEGAVAPARSGNLHPKLVLLDLSSCDIRVKGCQAIAKCPNLSGLQELKLNTGDYDKTKWNPTTLKALFPRGWQPVS